MSVDEEFCVACGYGNAGEVRRGLALGANPNAVDRGAPALYCAAMQGHEAVVTLLLEAQSWAHRLSRAISFPGLKQVQKFLESTARPAFEDVNECPAFEEADGSECPGGCEECMQCVAAQCARWEPDAECDVAFYQGTRCNRVCASTDCSLCSA